MSERLGIVLARLLRASARCDAAASGDRLRRSRRPSARPSAGILEHEPLSSRRSQPRGCGSRRAARRPAPEATPLRHRPRPRLDASTAKRPSTRSARAERIVEGRDRAALPSAPSMRERIERRDPAPPRVGRAPRGDGAACTRPSSRARTASGGFDAGGKRSARGRIDPERAHELLRATVLEASQLERRRRSARARVGARPPSALEPGAGRRREPRRASRTGSSLARPRLRDGIDEELERGSVEPMEVVDQEQEAAQCAARSKQRTPEGQGERALGRAERAQSPSRRRLVVRPPAQDAATSARSPRRARDRTGNASPRSLSNASRARYGVWRSGLPRSDQTCETLGERLAPELGEQAALADARAHRARGSARGRPRAACCTRSSSHG